MTDTANTKLTGGLLACPFCGSPAEHESTITQEIVRCTLCPATMSYGGSGAAVKAMWNGRVRPFKANTGFQGTPGTAYPGWLCSTGGIGNAKTE